MVLALLAIMVPAVRASAPTFHGSASSPADNGSQADAATLTITPPASMSSGDLVAVICTVQVAAFSTAPAVNATGGQTWSSGSDITGANDMDVRVFWTQYNGTWSADPSFVIASESGTQPASCIMHVFRPSTAGTWEVDTAIAGGAEASADPISVTGITPNKKDTVSLACALIPNASTFSEDSADWTITSTAQYRNTAGSDLSVSCAYKLQGAAAATGDASFNPSTAAAGISFTMAWNNALVPTISPNTADAHDFGSDSTPTLEATGTDGNADDLRYQFQIDSVNTFDSGGSVVDNSYSESNQDGVTTLGSTTNKGWGQSFTAVGGTLKKVTFYLRKNNSPTGNAVVRIYKASALVNGIPSGSALGTSSNVDVSTLSTSFALVDFTFTGSTVVLAPSEVYFTTVEYDGNSGTNNLSVGVDTSSPSHEGTDANQDRGTGNWSPGGAGGDLTFYVYTADPQLAKISGTDSGFANTVTGGDTDPFNSAEKVSFTVQAGDALAGGTWYWRARAKDPNGSNTYSSWTTTRSFTIATGTNFPRSVADSFFVPNELSARVYGAVRAPADAIGAAEVSVRVYGAARAANDATGFVADVSARIRGTNVSVFDGLNLAPAEQVDRSGSGFFRAPADASAGPVSEFAARIASFPRAGNEQAGSQESAARIFGAVRLTNESITSPAEISSRVADVLRSTADATGAAEAVAKTADHPRAASDAAVPQESPVRLYGALRAAAEAFLIAELGGRFAEYGRSTADSVFVPGDSSIRGFQYSRSAAEAFFGISESAARVQGSVRTAADGTDAAELGVRLFAANRSVSEAAGTAETGARLAGYARAGNEAFAAAESAVRVADLSRAIADSSGAAESPLRVYGAVRSAADATGAAELSTRLYAAFRNAADSTTLFEWSARLAANSRSVSDALIPSDISERQVNNNRQDYDRIGADAGLFGEAAARLVSNTRAASDASGAAEASARSQVLARAVSDGAFVADLGARQLGLTRSAAEASAAAEAAARALTLTRSATDQLFLQELGRPLSGRPVLRRSQVY